MKAVIVDIKGKYAVALNKNGEFVKIRNNGRYKIGYEYDIKKSLPMAKVARIASVAALFTLVVGISAGVYSYNMPYSYVDIEINPGVEITANIFDRIINVRSINDEGERLLPPDGIKNKVLQEGINIILSNAVEQGYLKKDEENAVIITVSAKDSNKAGQLEERIEAAAAEKLKSYSVKSEILVEEIAVEEKNKVVKESKEYGITPGKLNLINKLIEENADLSIDDLKDKPVKEIMKAVKELRNNTHDNEKNNENRKNDKSKKNNKDNENNKSNKNNKNNVSNKNSENTKDTVSQLNKVKNQQDNKKNQNNSSIKSSSDTNSVKKFINTVLNNILNRNDNRKSEETAKNNKDNKGKYANRNDKESNNQERSRYNDDKKRDSRQDNKDRKDNKDNGSYKDDSRNSKAENNKGNVNSKSYRDDNSPVKKGYDKDVKGKDNDLDNKYNKEQDSKYKNNQNKDIKNKNSNRKQK